MFPAFALAIALNVLQPGDTPATRAAPAVSETTPVAVPPATPLALRYYTSGNRLWVLDQVLSILLLAVILFSGVSATLRTWSRRIGRNWFFTIVVYFALFTIVTSVITLPLTYYEEFVRQHDYGLSNQTLLKWWTDSLTTLAVTCVAGGLFLWVPYLLLRKSPRRWWLYTAAAAIPFIVVANLVAPIWIAPLFNKFEPMHDKALEARILALADRAGIEGSRVFEVDKSVDTKALNAYVSGLGNTKRVVLWDTIIARLASVTNLGDMAGVMMRDTLAPESTFAMVGLRQWFSNNTFVYRTSTLAGSGVGTSSNGYAPFWYKLVRAGNNFTAYASVDDSSWLQHGSTQVIPMANTIYIGLAVDSNPGNVTTATFDNVTVTTP